MKRNYFGVLFLIPLMLLAAWVLSCSGKPGAGALKNATGALPEKNEPAAKEAREIIRLESPEGEDEYRMNNPIKVMIAPAGKGRPDSVRVWYDGKPSGIITAEPWTHEIVPQLVSSTGRKALRVTAWKSGVKPQTITCFVNILSDITPGRTGYRVINTYPHDKEAFTQGLLYHEGFLYEGTGQETRSSLRKTEIKTGLVINQHNLDPKLFGEGIAIHKGKIYQLTWQSKVGFVYDLATFRLINKFYYQTEGWGLTTMGDSLVMSDGSNSLYIVDPGMFVKVDRIEVCDDKGRVSNLNELEYINGEVWANIWQTDLIARIEPSTGRVLSYVNIKGIMGDPSFDTSINVANGIAYDREGDRIFVTGKNWPKLFEIKVSE